jgi:hypothetical protein
MRGEDGAGEGLWAPYLIAKLTGRSVETIWRWARQGCDLNSPASIKEFLEGNELRRNSNSVRRGKTDVGPNDITSPDLNGIELGPIGKRGAAAALERLSAESPALMTKTDLGEFKFSAIESFRGILYREDKGSLKANPIPGWAAAKVIEAWNVSTL